MPVTTMDRTATQLVRINSEFKKESMKTLPTKVIDPACRRILSV
jgi:hypothetical protein